MSKLLSVKAFKDAINENDYYDKQVISVYLHSNNHVLTFYITQKGSHDVETIELKYISNSLYSINAKDLSLYDLNILDKCIVDVLNDTVIGTGFNRLNHKLNSWCRYE